MIRSRYRYNNVDNQALENVQKDMSRDIDEYSKIRKERKGWLKQRSEKRQYVKDRNERYKQTENLRNDVKRELRAVGNIEKRIGRIRSPEVQEVVYDILNQARERGMSVDEVLQALPDGGIKGRVSPASRSSLYWILGSLLLSALIFPSANQNMRNFAGKVADGASDLSDKLQAFVEETREGLEDIIAEAHFNRLKKSMDSGDEGEPQA
ncbi:MAG: hypothetical protein K9L17_03935 [Clostridiales bacterium]|nr:hypothetical protein [Clostridiales bacterium]MCF8021829.1 hypothetical protein [Clostridiales bacterium]